MSCAAPFFVFELRQNRHKNGYVGGYGGSLRWLPRVFTNNPSYLAYDTEGNPVTMSLRSGSRNSPLTLPL